MRFTLKKVFSFLVLLLFLVGTTPAENKSLGSEENITKKDDVSLVNESSTENAGVEKNDTKKDENISSKENLSDAISQEKGNVTSVESNTSFEGIDEGNLSKEVKEDNNTRKEGSHDNLTESDPENKRVGGGEDETMSEGDGVYDYVEIGNDTMIEDVQDKKENVSQNKSDLSNKSAEKEVKEIDHVFYEDNLKSFELKSEKRTLPEIKKEERITKNGKEVVISSKEHIEEDIRVYTNLEEEVEKSKIKVNWKNEDKDVTGGLSYYDKNDDGLVERISWVVPHLSEQVFEVVIIKENNTAPDMSGIMIEDLASLEGVVNGPNVTFEFNVTYNDSREVDCSLDINGTNFSSTLEGDGGVVDLDDGEYHWDYSCVDSENSSIKNSTSGDFVINESFEIMIPRENLLKFVGDGLYEDGFTTVEVSSGSDASIRAYVEGPDGENKTGNLSDVGNLLIDLEEGEILSHPGEYTLHAYFFNRTAQPVYLRKNFYLSVVEMQLLKSVAGVGEEVGVRVDIDASESNELINGLIFHWGDGDDYTELINQKSYSAVLNHSYSEEGSKAISADLYLGERENLVVDIGQVEIISQEDERKPKITLYHPEDGEDVANTTVVFKFKASDDVALNYCNFSIYNATDGSYTDSDLEYESKETNIENDTLKEITFVNFSKREYAWEVSCIDNSSNVKNMEAFFTIGLNSSEEGDFGITSEEEVDYERKEDVEELLEKATEFIKREEEWSAEEKEALKDLGIIDDVKFYKKRLLDIEQTLARNLKFIEDDDLREKRREESLEEIDEIKNNLPIDIKIIKEKDYIKNGNSLDWEKVIKEYLEKTNTKLKSSVDSLKDENKRLQNNISSETNVKNIEIDYLDKEEELTLVKKKVKTTDASGYRVLEIIPEELADKNITFLSESSVISENSIFDITKERDEFTVICKIDEAVDPEEVEKGDTILYTEKAQKRKIIHTLSGFLVLGPVSDVEVDTVLFSIILIFVALILLVWIVMTFRKARIKKDPNVYFIFDKIESIKKNLRERNINDARENYKKISERYHVLDNRQKAEVISVIQKAQKAIDRRDVFNLLEEYKSAKNKFNKEEATELYEQIRKIYKRMDKKDRQKVVSVLNGA